MPRTTSTGSAETVPEETEGMDGKAHRTRRLTSDLLFGAANLVRIQHNGMTYTLRKTRNGKLILTK